MQWTFSVDCGGSYIAIKYLCYYTTTLKEVEMVSGLGQKVAPTTSRLGRSYPTCWDSARASFKFALFFRECGLHPVLSRCGSSTRSLSSLCWFLCEFCHETIRTNRIVAIIVFWNLQMIGVFVRTPPNKMETASVESSTVADWEGGRGAAPPLEL